MQEDAMESEEPNGQGSWRARSRLIGFEEFGSLMMMQGSSFRVVGPPHSA